MRRAASVAEPLTEPPEVGDPTALDNTHAPFRGKSFIPVDAWVKTQCIGRSFPIPNILSHCIATGRAPWTSNVSRSHPAVDAVIPHTIRYETVRD
jgi:hypothetical protein